MLVIENILIAIFYLSVALLLIGGHFIFNDQASDDNEKDLFFYEMKTSKDISNKAKRLFLCIFIMILALNVTNTFI